MSAPDDGHTFAPSAYWMVHTRRGDLASLYPIVAPVLVAPLYLPAFEHQILVAEARREDDKSDDLDWGVEAGGLTIGADEDDDFY